MLYNGDKDTRGLAVAAEASEQNLNPRWALWEVCTGGGETTYEYILWIGERRREFLAHFGGDDLRAHVDGQQRFDAWLAAWADKDRGIA